MRLRLLLDAPIDVALNRFDLRENRVRAASLSLDALLDRCEAISRCARDTPTATLGEAYDSLRLALADRPATASYFGSDGASRQTVVLIAGKLEHSLSTCFLGIATIEAFSCERSRLHRSATWDP